jgi:hypothetical protein
VANVARILKQKMYDIKDIVPVRADRWLVEIPFDNGTDYWDSSVLVC